MLCQKSKGAKSAVKRGTQKRNKLRRTTTLCCVKRKVKSGNSAVSSHRKSRNETRKQRRNYEGVMTTQTTLCHENRGTVMRQRKEKGRQE